MPRLSALPKPLLDAFAAAFGAAVLLFSVTWMVYIRDGDRASGWSSRATGSPHLPC